MRFGSGTAPSLEDFDTMKERYESFTVKFEPHGGLYKFTFPWSRGDEISYDELRRFNEITLDSVTPR